MIDSFGLALADLDVTPTVRAAAAWTPAALPSLLAWFDPSYGVYSDAGTTPAVVGDPVYRWVTRNNSSIYAEQATLANRPILRQGANGRYYLEFDGSNDKLLCPSDQNTNTWFANYQAAATGFANAKRIRSGAYHAIFSTDNAPGNAGFQMTFSASPANVLFVGYGSTYRDGNNTTAGWVRYCGTAQWNGSVNVGKMYQDNTETSAAGNNSASTLGSGHLSIGAFPLTSYNFGGYIGDIAIQGAVASSTERAAMDTYMATQQAT